MQKFKFRFEPVKRVKEVIEKQIQKEISIIEQEISDCFEDVKQLKEKRTEFINKEKNFISASELQFCRSYVKSLNEKITAIYQKTEELKLLKEKKSEELLQKIKEKKIYQKLEEIHKDIYKEEEKKSEADFINELAVQKYARKSE